jgi:osmoprotectant transport system ATP-binding protein
MSQIVLENVGKSYAQHAALDGVTLTFRDETTTAVVGPSGSGKSTLLQLINGLVQPDSGVVSVFGRPVDYDNLPQLRLQIGYAVQGTGLFPHMNAWGNITLLARLERWPQERITKRARHLMGLVGLPDTLAERYPHELSGGEQQRVGLCRAMMLDPKIFLLDEPFGALDPITRTEIHAEFLGLQSSEARTIVLVTHDLREAFKLSERIVILVQGRVVQDGSRREILESPASEVVRDLVHEQLDSWSPQ